MTPAWDAADALTGVALTGAASAEGHACFAAALPVFLGHFPGQPLVPGVYQVALVGELVRRALARPDLTLVRIARCKWTLPLVPGDELLVTAAWTIRPDGGIQVDGGVQRAGVSACACRVVLN